MESIQPFDRLYEADDSTEEIVLREREIHHLAQICLDCFRDWAISHQTPRHLVQDVCDHCRVIELFSIFAQATAIHINSYASWPPLDSEETDGGFFPLTDDEPRDMRELRLKSWISMIPALFDGYLTEMNPFREGYTERLELASHLIGGCRQWAKLNGHSERHIRQALDSPIFERSCRILAYELSGKLEQRIQQWEEGVPWSFLIS